MLWRCARKGIKVWKEVGVDKATPNRGLHRLRLDGHGDEDELGDRGSEHRGHDHIITKRTEETVLVQGMDGRVE